MTINSCNTLIRLFDSAFPEILPMVLEFAETARAAFRSPVERDDFSIIRRQSGAQTSSATVAFDGDPVVVDGYPRAVVEVQSGRPARHHVCRFQ